MSVKSIFTGVINDLRTAGGKVKTAFLKTMSELDNVVLPEAQKLQPLLDTVAEALVPGSHTYVDLAVNWLEHSAAVIDAGGAAAEQNLESAGFDVAAIAAVKALIPQLKAALAQAQQPAPPAA